MHLSLVRFLWIPLAALLTAAPLASAAEKKTTKSQTKSTVKAAPKKTATPKPVAPPAAPAVAPKPAKVDTAAAPPDTSTVAVKIYEYIAYPTLQLITWPVQNILAPGVELLTYPSQEPIRYFIEENVIDRTLALFSMGRHEDIRVYPTISLASGTASRVGAVMRDEAPFDRDSERLVSYLLYYVNGDYKIRSYLVARELGGTDFIGKVAFSLNRVKNTQFYEPDENTMYFYENRSESYALQLDYPLVLGFSARGGFTFSSNRFDESLASAGTPLTSDFFRNENDSLDPSYRGLNQSFFDRSYKFGFVRDSRNNPNIPVDGSVTEITGGYHDVDKNHDFYDWNARYTKFFKLGRERYEITAEEEKNGGGLNMEEFIRKLEYQRLRQRFFSRKVVVVNFVGAQSYEIPGNSMPLYGLQTLGNNTPLRGYSGPRFRNYSIMAASAEYRFPILRLMDGTLFNEYGVFGKSVTEPKLDNLKNSWGFGIRVRRPDMFLFKVEIAFHGFSGVVLNATADAPF